MKNKKTDRVVMVDDQLPRLSKEVLALKKKPALRDVRAMARWRIHFRKIFGGE